MDKMGKGRRCDHRQRVGGFNLFGIERGLYILKFSSRDLPWNMMNFNFVNGGSKGWMQVSIFELYLLQVKFTEEATHYLSSL